MNDFIDYDKKFLNFSMRQSLLTKEDEITYIKNWQVHKNEKCLNKIVSSHLRLVISIANKFKNYGIPINELVQEGNIGLMQAVEKFDLNKDVRFSTYSSWWIKAAMQSFILKNWSIVRIGTTAAQKSLFFKLKSIMTKIEKENNSTFNDYHQRKLADELGVKFKEIEDIVIEPKSMFVPFQFIDVIPLSSPTKSTTTLFASLVLDRARVNRLSRSNILQYISINFYLRSLNNRYG